MSSKDNDGEHVMHLKSENVEMMINDKEDEVTEETFQSFLSTYQIGLEISMKASDFVFDRVHLLDYKCHKINFERGTSYIDSPDLIKNKKATINPFNKKDTKCFQ